MLIDVNSIPNFCSQMYCSVLGLIGPWSFVLICWDLARSVDVESILNFSWNILKCYKIWGPWWDDRGHEKSGVCCKSKCWNTRIYSQRSAPTQPTFWSQNGTTFLWRIEAAGRFCELLCSRGDTAESWPAGPWLHIPKETHFRWIEFDSKFMRNWR